MLLLAVDASIDLEVFVPDWRSRESISIKRAMVEAAHRDHVPHYLYFDLGPMAAGFVWQVEEEIVAEVKRLFFPDREPSFGDIEVHSSHGMTGSGHRRPGVTKSFAVLRVRNADRMEYVITLKGRECHLFEFQGTYGYNAEGKPDWQAERVGLDGHSLLSVNFMDAWGDPSGLDRQEAACELPTTIDIVITVNESRKPSASRSLFQRFRDMIGL